MRGDVPAAEPDASRHPWGTSDALCGFLVAFLGAGAVGALWSPGSGESLARLAAVQLAFWLGLTGSAVVASRLRGTGDLRVDLGFDVRWRDAGIGLPIGVAMQVVMVPLIYLAVTRFTGDLDVSGPARELVDRASGPSRVLLALGVIVVAPVVEELFFRGLLLRGLQRRLPAGLAVAVAAVLFGATHFQLVQLPALAAVGAVLAALAVRFRRLGVAIWAHIAFNATAVGSLLLLG